ncbi:MAG: DNA mismatch endonuclease Vsr [Rhodopseudomonas sp.]|uniref:very short patch repair endonuclease n=1 Tax=Rhodopseudomonas sp. TaxID=1078 RepID=UPI0018547BDD|nr:very short patch repair endonuclease [Rhodopseudomonas sp.]NVN84613.1 DNA mismatch endonuclease Vsr [Rhodopseudomonas sp.]
MDIVSSDKRSSMMAAVRQKHTKPEVTLRSAVHRLGLRFRLHRRDLPGSPDLVFPAALMVVFVHGCFWHRHEGCRKATTPATRAKFWQEKFAKNIARDRTAKVALENAGWKVLVVWECELSSANAAATVARSIATQVKKELEFSAQTC